MLVRSVIVFGYGVLAIGYWRWAIGYWTPFGLLDSRPQNAVQNYYIFLTEKNNFNKKISIDIFSKSVSITNSPDSTPLHPTHPLGCLALAHPCARSSPPLHFTPYSSAIISATMFIATNRYRCVLCGIFPIFASVRAIISGLSITSACGSTSSSFPLAQASK